MSDISYKEKAAAQMDKTLLKGLRVLELMSELIGEEYTIDQIADIAGLTKSNTHRTLKTLAHANYVKQDEKTGRYRCTLKMFEIGAKQLSQLDVRKYASPFLRELAYATNETVHLSIMDALAVVYIDKVDSPQPLVAYSTLGGRAPAHVVATGKVLLAFQHNSSIRIYVDAINRGGTKDPIDISALDKEFIKIRKCGYATNLGNWRPGIGGVAAPIFDGLNEVHAALGISAPLERLSGDVIEGIVPLIRDAARRISTRLGYKG